MSEPIKLEAFDYPKQKNSNSCDHGIVFDIKKTQIMQKIVSDELSKTKTISLGDLMAVISYPYVCND